MSDTDPQDAQITRLLTDLANDPAAPPSTVDALSVIRAARAAAEADGSPDRPTDDQGAGRSAAVAASAEQPASADVLPFRPSRRRWTVLALVAAASVVAVAALVIPLSLSGGSSTSTSADAERAFAASAAGDRAGGDKAAGVAPEQSPAAAAAPDLGMSSAAAAGPAAPPAADGSAAAGHAPAENAPADGFTAGADCWPALSDPVALVLDTALPAGAFGDLEPLTGDCAAVPVGGALLPARISPDGATASLPAASAADAALVVRISKAAPGACVDPDRLTGVRCARQLDGIYLATDGPGAPTVYVYGGGNEVAIGGSPATGAGSGLSVDQLTAAARAVLGSLG